MTTADSGTRRHSRVSDLERLLDQVSRNGGPFSTSYTARKDRQEEFPTEAVRILDDFGLHLHYVPARLGGLLDSVPDLVQLLRVVSRRDLTVAVAYAKTFLGTVPVWVGGSPEQAAWLAKEVCSNAALVTWALTERHHGADLLSGELSAARTDAGWRLHGAKWLINNATRAHLAALLARTDPAGGTRGFSLFLVDKRDMEPGGYTCLPKERTHGVRGVDISGIDFHGGQIPAAALIGEVGAGIEVVLKSLQITRTVCVALSVGAADHALRLAADFVGGRVLYGRRLAELPNVSWALGNVAALVLLAEVVSAVGARCIHALPSEMSAVAPVIKAFVPTVVDDAIDEAGELLGVRGLLTEEYADGMFQKLERDHRILAIFDGSTVVNRISLINQFPLLARAYAEGRWDAAGVAVAANLAAPLPELDTDRLTLLSRQGSSLVQSVPDAVVRTRELAARGEVPELVTRQVEMFGEAVDTVMTELAAHRPTPRDVPPEAFTLAWRYELCFAGAACLRVWLHNNDVLAAPEAGGALWQDATWLSACLASVLLQLGVIQEEDCAQAYDSLAEVLLKGEHGSEFTVFVKDREGESRP